MSDEVENNDSSNNEDSVEEEIEELLSIAQVIDGFLHQVLDIEDCGRDYITIASTKYEENGERITNDLTESQKLLKKDDEDNTQLFGIKGLSKAIREIDRHINSSPVSTLEKSLFIYLFAAFDKYIGDLVAVLYNSNQDLYKNINREIQLSEAIKFTSIDELKHSMLSKEIETLRRKSYIEQFKDLENKFSIKLTKFEDWSNFIECSQRRNLFTHCDGVISKQYIDVCRSAGVIFDKEPIIGEKLEVGTSYFFQSCHVVSEVAVLLGQTLWRKTQPTTLDKADDHLSSLVFDYLHMEKWGKAIFMSKFALGLPKISTDVTDRIFTVNYAIALKAINKCKAAKNVLDKKDWSATTYDFKLAYAVLTDNHTGARDLMIKMGKKGELVTELAYHDWPLFREFRDTEEFFDGYHSVYGYKYSSKLSTLADEKKSEVKQAEIAIE